MSKIVRNSKFRHVVGKGEKPDNCYNGLKTEGLGDTNCSVSMTFFAMIKSSKIYVVPLPKTGRQEENNLFYIDCKSKVLDVQWSPFNDHVLASCEDSGDVDVWEIPDGGLTETINEPYWELHGIHQKKVQFVSWHPSAEHILATGGHDPFIIIWDCQKQTPLIEIPVGDAPTTLAWNCDGSRVAILTKTDKIELRVINPRTGEKLMEPNPVCYQGMKQTKILYTKHGNIVTVGSDLGAVRSIILWDGDNVQKNLCEINLGGASNVMNIYYDPDLSILYTYAKGDCNVDYYEIDEYRIHYLTTYASKAAQRGGGFLPKRGVNAQANEIAKFYKLQQTKCEPVSFTVPRKSEQFQTDIYPDCLSGLPSLTAEEWIAGKNAEPRRCSFREMLGISVKPEIGRAKLAAKPEKKMMPKRQPMASMVPCAAAGEQFQQKSQNNGVLLAGNDLTELLEDMKKVKATVRKLNRRVAKLEEMLELKETEENQEEE